MDLLRWIQGRAVEEASSPAEAPSPLPPPGGGGRTPYPDYEVMAPDKWAHDWDEKTRRLVLDRIRNVPQRAFFSETQFALLEAICARLLPQDDRPEEQRIPIVPFIDQQLARGGGDGYCYEEMSWDQAAYLLALTGVDQTSQSMFGGTGFTELEEQQQDQVLAALESGHPPGDVWRQLPAAHCFKMLMRDVVEMYYSHPTAWNEVGFQGPASPRGHVRLSLGKSDPWEAAEQRPLPPEERRAAAPRGRHRAAPGHGGATN